LIISSIHAVGISDKSITYFLAIFIFTLIIKSVILPLTIKQTVSTVKMQEMQPKIKALQEKYKNDPKTLQQKQMELYKESGANPLAGCLPLLIQLPIFMAMYSVIYNFGDFNSVGFLWVKSLGKPDSLYILPVLSGLSTFLSMLMVQPKGNDPSVKTQKQMSIFMSAFSVWIGLKFKSALVLYWIIGNVIQMLQQYFIIGKIRRKEEEKLKLKLEK
jgi:YidC/Oxa1 family membrane protein insertase